MANQFLSLSLFLMLLSFFIVLNAISSFEDVKSQPVLNSLSLTFSQDAERQNLKSPVQEENPRVSDGKGDTFDKIEGLFKGHIAAFDVAKNKLGTVMHVRVPITQFENAINLSALDYLDPERGERGAFAQTIVTVLRSEQQKHPYRIDAILNISSDPATQIRTNPDAFHQELERMADIASKLEENGLPKKMVTIGLTQGEDGYVDLYFRRYRPFNLSTQIQKAQEL